MTIVGEVAITNVPRPIFEEIALSRRIYEEYPPERYAESLRHIGSLTIPDLEKIGHQLGKDPELVETDRQALTIVFNNRWLDTHGKEVEEE